MATAMPKYHKNEVEVLPAGERRFLVKSGNGVGHSYSLERGLGKLMRRVGAVIERTGYGATVYITFPKVSKATGNSCDNITDAILAEFLASK